MLLPTSYMSLNFLKSAHPYLRLVRVDNYQNRITFLHRQLYSTRELPFNVQEHEVGNAVC